MIKNSTNDKKKIDVPDVIKTNPRADKSSIISIFNNKIITDLAEKQKLRPRDIRRNFLVLSLLLSVILPTILGTYYFLFIASDRYTASAGFSVRSMDSSVGGSDLLGTLSGLSSIGSTTTDSYIILEYLHSRELIDRLRQDFTFREAYGNENIDFFFRLQPDQPVEKIIDYWDWMISTSYDNSSEIIRFEVQAFTPEDAHAVANLVVKYSQDLINKLSEQARNDAVRFATKEVAIAEMRLKINRDRLADFRAKSSAIDPQATATAQLEIVTQLETQLISFRSQLATLLAGVSEASPRVQPLRNQITSLEKAIANQKLQNNGLDDAGEEISKSLSSLLAGYEKLKVEQEFAQQTYGVALSSLERARAEADRQQRFLAIFSSPRKAEAAIYPMRIINSLLLLIGCCIIWGVGTLLAYSVRDHMK